MRAHLDFGDERHCAVVDEPDAATGGWSRRRGRKQGGGGVGPNVSMTAG
jgi:hypothetical protein